MVIIMQFYLGICKYFEVQDNHSHRSRDWGRSNSLPRFIFSYRLDFQGFLDIQTRRLVHIVPSKAMSNCYLDTLLWQYSGSLSLRFYSSRAQSWTLSSDCILRLLQLLHKGGGTCYFENALVGDWFANSAKGKLGRQLSLKDNSTVS